MRTQPHVSSLRILSEVPIGPAAGERLRMMPGLVVEMLPAHHEAWDAPASLAAGAQVLLCKRVPENLDALTDLKLLQLSTVGYEHLRQFKLGERAFPVCNARGIFDTAIAEWNLAMMVALVRDLKGMMRNQEQSRWEKTDRAQQEVRGRVVGLWGDGGIGRETARLAHAFGMTIHVMTRRGMGPRFNVYTPPGTGDPQGVLPRRVFVAGQEKEFLGGLDFLVLALP